MSSEDGDLFRQMRERKKDSLKQKEEWTKELINEWLEGKDVEYKEIQPWHLRLSQGEHILDIFPQKGTFHRVKPTNERGKIKNLIPFLNSIFYQLKK